MATDRKEPRMSQPMTAEQFIHALTAEGCTVVETNGWRTHNRNHKGPWGPLHGVMIHHTAGVFDGIVEYCRTGSAELPGPLSQVVIDKQGVIYLIGWGRANHAGGGDPAVLEAVINEESPLPKSHEHQGSDGAVDGNAHFVGAECVNKGDGKDPWPAVQITAMQRFTAAVCRFYGWSARSGIRHLDWSDYKSDPAGVDWVKFQAAVQKLLDGKPSTPVPQPNPTVSLSNLIEAATRDPAKPQGGTTHKADVLLFERALVKLGFLDAQWADGSFGTKTREATVSLQTYLGHSGTGADGIPGPHSTTYLGLKSHLFTMRG